MHGVLRRSTSDFTSYANFAYTEFSEPNCGELRASARKGKSLRFRNKSAEGYSGGRSTGRALSGAEDEVRRNVEHVGTKHASITSSERGSDSPYVESIMHGRTLREDSPTRPAESHWHMVFVRKDGEAWVVFVGPLTTAGVAHYAEGAEILWIKFKLGTFMPHLPAGRFLDTETVLPGASKQSFWLKGSTGGFPDYENAKTFVDRLVGNASVGFRVVVATRILTRGGCFAPETSLGCGFGDTPH
jgi:hypothetical protein